MTKAAAIDVRKARHALAKIAETGTCDPSSVEQLDVGTADYLDQLDAEVFDGLIAHGASTVRVFIGGYGSGKTHLLDMIGARAKRRGMIVARCDLSSMQGLHHWDEVVRSLIQAMVLRADADDEVRGLPAILEHLREEGATPAALDGVRTPHPAFLQAIRTAIEPDSRSPGAADLLGRYLSGERVRVGDLRAAKLRGIKAPLSRRNAAVTLHTVLASLAALGRGTLVLFDESERTLSRARGVNLSSEANLVRRLIDGAVGGDLPGTLIVFGVLPDFVERASQAYPALGQRLSVPASAPSVWRWPVLEVADVNAYPEPEDFLSAAVDRFLEIAAACGARPEGLRMKLREAGAAAIKSQAGASYRRDMLRALSAVVLETIEGPSR